MNTLTLQATFCGLLHGLGKLAFRADKTAADLLADLPDTPEWAAVRGGFDLAKAAACTDVHLAALLGSAAGFDQRSRGMQPLSQLFQLYFSQDFWQQLLRVSHGMPLTLRVLFAQ